MPSAAESHPPLRVALLGCGVVGTQVARLLTEQADDLASRVGAPLELVGIAVRDSSAPRDAAVDRSLLTEDAAGLVERADIVVEVMGGTEPARSLLLRAIEAGAAVVTANKALLAEDGPTLYKAADAAGVDIYFEAAVAGAIPIVRPVRESLAGDRVRRVLGIVNGTTNYVLDQMASTGRDLDEAVREAQDLGYAEADPTADVEGYDAAAKAAILASLAFHTRVSSTTSRARASWPSRPTTSRGPRRRATSSSSSPSPNGATATPPARRRACPCACTPRSCRPRTRSRTCAARSTRCSSRRSPRASSCSTGAARAAPDGVRRPGRRRLRRPPPRARGQGAAGVHVRRAPDPPGERRGHALPGAPRRRGPPGRARAGRARAEHGVSIEAVRQPTARGGADVAEPGVAELLITTHAAPESALSATVAAVAELEPVRTITSVLRVEGA